MNLVQPIRDKEKLEEMKEELKKRGTRDYLLFYTGINTRAKSIRHQKFKML